MDRAALSRRTEQCNKFRASGCGAREAFETWPNGRSASLVAPHEKRKELALEINELFAASVERSKEWHPGGVDDWSPLEWAGAMCGEAGEAANAAKKLKRVEDRIKNINVPGRLLDEAGMAGDMVAEEVADTILYGLLVMARVGVTNPEAVLRRVFNAKSAEYGFPQRV